MVEKLVRAIGGMSRGGQSFLATRSGRYGAQSRQLALPYGILWSIARGNGTLAVTC